MKKLLISCLVVASGMSVSTTFANSPTVPALSANTNDPLPLFSEQRPLSERDRLALEKADEWINADQYPFRDGQRVTYLYGGGQASVVCAPLELCIVELEEGERVVPDGVHVGDSARWMVSPSVGANNRTNIIIKPVEVGLQTSLAVITDRRTYHMRLTSRRNDYMPLIGFHYPENIQEKWQEYYDQQETERERLTLPGTGENIADLDFDYRISGCSSCSWRPERVYNNGEQTIIQMGADMNQSEAPALLVMSRQGEQLVNYRVREDRYVVDGVFEEAVMVVGVGRSQDRVSIRRTGR